MKFLKVLLISLSLMFAGCATTDELDKVKAELVKQDKIIATQLEVLNQHNEAIHSLMCLISAQQYNSEYSDCKLNGELCLGRVKGKVLYIPIVDEQPLITEEEPKKKKRPTTVAECLNQRDECVRAAYAYFMKVQLFRGCQ